jgi:hypothetical protein
MHFTNPINEVLDEAEQIFGAEKRVNCVLSLGTTTSPYMTMPSNLAHLEVHGLLQAMELQQGKTTQDAHHRFGDLEAYHRLSVDSIGIGCLNNWINWDGDIVETMTRSYIEQQPISDQLDAAAGQIKAGLGTVTLHRLSK